MSKAIDHYTKIVFAKEPTSDILDAIYEVCREYTALEVDFEETDTFILDFRLTAHVGSGFSTPEFLNALHAIDPSITSVVAIDLENAWSGSFTYSKSEKTKEQQAALLFQSYLGEVVECIQKIFEPSAESET